MDDMSDNRNACANDTRSTVLGQSRAGRDSPLDYRPRTRPTVTTGATSSESRTTCVAMKRKPSSHTQPRADWWILRISTTSGSSDSGRCRLSIPANIGRRAHLLPENQAPFRLDKPADCVDLSLCAAPGRTCVNAYRRCSTG